MERFGGLAADVTGRRGDEPPLVLVPGLTFDRSIWRPITEQGPIARSQRLTVAVDLPGHGGSATQDDYRIEAVAATLHRAVVDAGLPDPVVVGHSVSGLIATAYGARHPTAAVVNIDQNLDIVPFAELVRPLEEQLRGSGFGDLWTMFEDSFHAELLPAAAQELVRSTSHPTQAVVLEYWREVFELSSPSLAALVDDVLAELRRTRVPYTFVSGGDVQPAERDWLTERLPDVRIEAWPGSGHFPHLARPEAFAQLLLDAPVLE